MKLHIIALGFVVVASVSTYGKQLPGDTDDNHGCTSSEVHSQSKIHVEQDGYEEQCPNFEDIAPCVCSYQSYVKAPDLDCSAVESDDQLRRIFQSYFPFKNFHHLWIMHNNNLEVLESYVFNDISFEQIDIHYCPLLQVIEINALDSCYETAISISLYVNNITSFPFDALYKFPNLTHFDISRNTLSIIPAIAFNGLNKLESLYLGNNNAPNIVGTFEHLPSLKVIWLNDNDLTIIPQHFIKSGSSQLSYIYLRYNNITSIEPGAFEIEEGLEKISMSANSLSTLDEATWRPFLEAGVVLWAAENSLSCDCRIAWLFAEEQLLKQVSYDTTCGLGVNIHDIDPSIYDDC